MKKFIFLLILFGLFTSCTKDEEPPIVFENVWLNIYNPDISTDESYYQSWDFLNPETNTEKVPEIKEIVSYGSEYRDSITFTIREAYGILSVVTNKQKITNKYETYTTTLTFHEEETDYYGHKIEVTKDGIFLDGKLVQSLSNFQIKETHSSLIDSETKQVQTTFKGETHQANSQNFTISNGNEEYKLTYVSPNVIEVSQTSPIQREIGTVERK